MLEARNALKDRECLTAARALYLEAFPKAERLPLSTLERRVRQGKADFTCYYDGEAFAGLSYMVPWKDIVYLFYLAVDRDSRDRGYGTAILESLKAQYPGRRILISIEEMDPASDNYEQRKRRKDFYERNGFRDTAIKFQEWGVVYDMLSFGGRVSGEEYSRLIRGFVGRIVFHFFYRWLG